ncbi:hypothetical protein WN51_09419 [Melipona quadrifasciata]|uniref:Uncharacterized protein n=1 Tax=Melipona quadrifasciata TaxID=166423 RepID=A0A0M8ZMD6_9HYME|nr:hypothetical protein WN51_09419 [Melipona quadrifasciata]
MTELDQKAVEAASRDIGGGYELREEIGESSQLDVILAYPAVKSTMSLSLIVSCYKQFLVTVTILQKEIDKKPEPPEVIKNVPRLVTLWPPYTAFLRDGKNRSKKKLVLWLIEQERNRAEKNLKRKNGRKERRK